MSPPRRLALMILIVLLAGAGAAPALAGEYPVYACEPARGRRQQLVGRGRSPPRAHDRRIANCPPASPARPRGAPGS